MADDDRLQRIESQLDAMQSSLGLIARETAKLEAHAAHASREIDRIVLKTSQIEAQIPELKIDVGKLHAKQSILSSTLGVIAGFFGSKF